MSEWTILGIEPTQDAREIRRAYAQQLKLHPVESDPAGFQALRAAYEAALHAASRGALPEPRERPAVDAARADPDRGPQPAHPPAPTPGSASADAPALVAGVLRALEASGEAAAVDALGAAFEAVRTLSLEAERRVERELSEAVLARPGPLPEQLIGALCAHLQVRERAATEPFLAAFVEQLEQRRAEDADAERERRRQSRERAQARAAEQISALDEALRSGAPEALLERQRRELAAPDAALGLESYRAALAARIEALDLRARPLSRQALIQLRELLDPAPSTPSGDLAHPYGRALARLDGLLRAPEIRQEIEALARDDADPHARAAAQLFLLPAPELARQRRLAEPERRALAALIARVDRACAPAWPHAFGEARRAALLQLAPAPGPRADRRTLLAAAVAVFACAGVAGIAWAVASGWLRIGPSFLIWAAAGFWLTGRALRRPANADGETASQRQRSEP